MSIEIDKHPSEAAEDALRGLLQTYSPEHIQEAVKNLGLDSTERNLESFYDIIGEQRTGGVIKSYILTLPDIGLAETTQKTYKELMRRFAQYCHKNLPYKLHTKFSEVLTKKFLSEWINWECPARKANSSRTKTIAFMRSFLKSTLTTVPEHLKGTLKLRGGNDDWTPKAYTTPQVQEMLQLARQRSTGSRDYAMLELFVGSGVREDELRLTQLRHINFEEETIRVHPKGDKRKLEERVVNSESFKVLRSYITFRYGDPKFLPPNDERYVFTGIGRKNAISPRSIQLIVKNLIKQCKSISETEEAILNVHSFRHFYAISQLRDGVDIYTISKLLGHKSVRSTEVYLRLFHKDLYDAVNSLSLTRLSERQLLLVRGGEMDED